VGRLKKLVIIGAIGAAFVVFAKRLMGGLGPQPGTDMAPKAWPSLVPEPTATAAEPSTNGAGTASGNGSASPAGAAESSESSDTGESTEADATTD
jgi:hypothetical protein